MENSTHQAANWGVGLAQAVAAQGFGVPIEAMTADNAGTQRAIRARHVAMYLSRMVFKLGATEIARAFRRTHPAVLNACKRVEEAREDPGFDRTVEWLETVLRRAAGATP